MQESQTFVFIFHSFYFSLLPAWATRNLPSLGHTLERFGTFNLFGVFWPFILLQGKKYWLFWHSISWTWMLWIRPVDINERKQKSGKSKLKSAEGRKNLSNVRVIQRKLVYVVGIPTPFADEEVWNALHSAVNAATCDDFCMVDIRVHVRHWSVKSILANMEKSLKYP